VFTGEYVDIYLGYLNPQSNLLSWCIKELSEVWQIDWITSTL